MLGNDVKTKTRLCLVALGGVFCLPATASAIDASTALDEVRSILRDRGAAAAATRESELSTALRVLALRSDALSPAARREADRYLARPSGPIGDSGANQRYPEGEEAERSPACAERVCVHWAGRGEHAPRADDQNGVADGDGIPDYVEQVLDSIRRTVLIEHRQLRWARPRNDGKLGEPAKGKSNRGDIYLLNLGSRVAGFAAADPGGKGRRRSGWVAIDNDFSEQGSRYLPLLQVTIAHEYNHLLQYGYDIGQETWLYESVATWMEDRVYPEANLYIGFVSDFARVPEAPLDSRSRMYGAATFQQFFAAQAGPRLLLDVWERGRKFSGRGRTYRAIDAALRPAGLGLEPLFGRFAAASAAWRDHPAFPDGPLLPRVKRTAPVRPGGEGRLVTLDRMSYAVSAIVGERPPAGLQIRVKGPRNVRGYAGLVVQRGGVFHLDTAEKLRRGAKTLALRRPAGVEQVEVVVVDTDARRERNHPSRRFVGDDRRFTITVK